MTTAREHFGANGQRIEFWKGNGYVHKQFRSEQHGASGECLGLVGFNISDREMLRTIEANFKAGTLMVCPIGQGY